MLCSLMVVESRGTTASGYAGNVEGQNQSAPLVQALSLFYKHDEWTWGVTTMYSHDEQITEGEKGWAGDVTLL